MIRFLFFTDPHAKGKNPKARKDFYPDTILDKISEVAQIEKDVDAEVSICGGDVLDIPDLAESVIINLCRVLRQFKTPPYTVVGNHEEFGQNPETVDRSMIGVIEATGMMNRLYMDDPLYFKGTLGEVVTMTGADSDYEIDKGGNVSHYCPKKPANSDIHIHVVHGYVRETPMMDTVNYTLIDDIVEHTEADIILTGHEHIGYGVVVRYNRHGRKIIFCNPGALGRISASLAEMDRMPGVAIINVYDKLDADIDIVKLKCALPAEEVLDRAAIEEEILKEETMAGFINNLSNFSMDNNVDIYAVMERLAKEESLPVPIINEARARLEKAEMEIAKEVSSELTEV